MNSFRSSDGRKPDAKPDPVIQIWNANEAPDMFRRLMDQPGSYDWLALVPAELKDPEVVSLLLRDTVNGLDHSRTLSDGSLLLAGHFVTGDFFSTGPIHAQLPKARKARSSGR
jgi:hypothetical protein